jgi:hypothetical protein
MNALIRLLSPLLLLLLAGCGPDPNSPEGIIRRLETCAKSRDELGVASLIYPDSGRYGFFINTILFRLSKFEAVRYEVIRKDQIEGRDLPRLHGSTLFPPEDVSVFYRITLSEGVGLVLPFRQEHGRWWLVGIDEGDPARYNMIDSEIETEPNKAMERSRLLVTDRAGARSAPSSRLAHLGR